MTSERAARLKTADTLLRQGKLQGAIEEYVRLVDEQPADWNSINVLGDLYARAGKVEQAVAHFARVADHLFTEGFYQKAAALYKKALKVQADHDHSQTRLADIAVRQGLMGDARTYLTRLASQRRARGDEAGAADCLARLAALNVREAKRVEATSARGDDDAPVAAKAEVPAEGDVRADLEVRAREEAHAAPAPAPVPLVVEMDSVPAPPTEPLEAVFERMRGDVEANRELLAAADWLRKAAEAAASPEERRSVLYELADLLERAGDISRALAVLTEIDGEGPPFRDVSARIEALTRAQAGNSR